MVPPQKARPSSGAAVLKTLYSIVGMQHRPGARDVIARLRVGAELKLIREPTNHYDFNAVQVWADGVHVGYIKASENAPVAREMDQRNAVDMDARFVVDGSRWPQAEVDLEA